MKKICKMTEKELKNYLKTEDGQELLLAFEGIVYYISYLEYTPEEIKKLLENDDFCYDIQYFLWDEVNYHIKEIFEQYKEEMGITA